MLNKRERQISVLDAEGTHDIMPKDFALAVKDIKLAILQARAKAARLANAEALKLYFYVGGYISKKTRSAKWGSGAIDALSNQLQVELPGLRGFSASSMIFMRLFYEAWAACPEIHHLVSDEFHYLLSNGIDNAQIHYLPSNEFGESNNRQMPSAEIRPMPLGELDKEDVVAFFSIGFTHHREIIRFCKSLDERLYYIHACAKAPWTVEQLQQHLRADDYHHIGALPNNFEKALSPIALASRAVRSFRDEYLLELVNLDNVDARADQDVDERVLPKSLVADVEKTIQALGGDDFFTRLSLRSSRVSGASWRTRGPNPRRSRKRSQRVARPQKESSDGISSAIGRSFEG
jgi:predicted nuclease of restriction endonuclease-like (RecB) superfamily